MLYRTYDVQKAKRDHWETKTTTQKLSAAGCYLFVPECQQD